MKIKILSDLHLEHHTFKYQSHGEDVVVLAGDIGEGTDGIHWAGENIDVPVIYVPGNHEYYDTIDFDYLNHWFKHKNPYSHVHILLNDHVVIDDVSFVGGTMWTDFKSRGISEQWFVMQDCATKIGDFVGAIKKYHEDDHRMNNFSTYDAVQEFDEFDKYIRYALVANGAKPPHVRKTVVVSHFCPSTKSIPQRFNVSGLNPYWASDMEKYMSYADFWIHGHTHDSFDYEVYGCRVLCNPRGYPSEAKWKELADNMQAFKEDFIIEV